MNFPRCFLRPTTTSLALLLLAAAGAGADTFILKNGTRYQGRIIKDEGDTLLLEIQASRTIRDERRVAKADIAKIEKENAAAAAYAEIAKLGNTPDLLTGEDYDGRIRQINAFIKQYSTAKETTDARKLIQALETERESIAAGSIKLNGHIIPPAQRSSDMVAIDAAILAKKFDQAAEEGRVLDALRLFDSIDGQFAGTAAHDKILPMVNRLLAAYAGQIDRSLATLDERVKQREIGLDRMPDADRERAKRIFTQQKAAFDQQVALDQNAKVKWITVDSFNKSSLDDAKRRIDAEIKRLERPATKTTTAPDQAYREAWTALEGADEEQVRKILGDVAKLKLTEIYVQKLKERAAEVGTTKEPAQKPE